VAIGEDFIHLAQAIPSRDLLAAVNAAFRGNGLQDLRRVEVPGSSGGEQRYLDITCYASTIESDQSVKQVVITMLDVSSHVHEQQRMLREADSRDAEIVRLRAQVERLTSSNAELQIANQDLMTVTMELRSANEEFLLGNEELQAATEEVETLNEELQATNEELETLNEELQATVEELNTTNDDLQARSVELQELAESLETERRTSDVERARLSAMLRSMADPVFMVDAAGKIVQTNAAYDEIFGSDGLSAFAPDGDGPNGDADATPQSHAMQGEAFTQEFLVSLPDGSRRLYEAKGAPIDSDDTGGGIVILRDMTEREARRS
jgi:two-component system CheB/CheR fusion protein